MSQSIRGLPWLWANSNDPGTVMLLGRERSWGRNPRANKRTRASVPFSPRTWLGEISHCAPHGLVAIKKPRKDARAILNRGLAGHRHCHLPAKSAGPQQLGMDTCMCSIGACLSSRAPDLCRQGPVQRYSTSALASGLPSSC